jgi:hypothetical protein
VQVTAAEDAFAIHHDEGESGMTGTVTCDGMEKITIVTMRKSQARVICGTNIRQPRTTPMLSNPKPSPTALDLELVKLRLPL